MAATLAVWGAAPADAAPVRKAALPVRIPVCPQAWPTVLLFLGLETQWRIALGFGACVYLGLDYGSAEILRRDDPELAGASIRDLRIMEAAAREILNQQEE